MSGELDLIGVAAVLSAAVLAVGAAAWAVAAIFAHFVGTKDDGRGDNGP